MFQFILKLLIFISINPVFGETQYKPTASSLNHNVSFGMSFEPDSGKIENPFSGKGGGFLNYYYFPPWDKWLEEKYLGYVLLGFGGGIEQFFHSPGLCSKGLRNKPLIARGGLHLRGVFWEYFQPFIGGGVSQMFCHDSLKNIGLGSKKIKLSPYMSLGLAISLKVLDRASIYNLDEDYGLNDLSFVSQCLQVEIPNKSKSKGIFICQLGLEVLF